MSIDEMKGILMIVGIILGSGFSTCIMVYLIYKKNYKKSFIVYALPGIITSVIIAFTLIPYALSYPDPVGSGLTMMFVVHLVIGSNIIGFVFGNYLRK